ncbi:MAG: ribosome maturation factor RimM [Nitratireductor sp.]|nr:ribosome maturation factor RimM [Nitratireductor sp.]
MNKASELSVLIAVIGAPHGVRGEVRVKPFGEADRLDQYGPLFDAAGRRFTIETLRPQKSVLVVRFAEVAGREAAEALNGVELFVPRGALPETEEDEFYLSDLIGLEAVSPEGERLGVVKAVDNYGAGDVVEIKFAAGGGDLFAFTRENFPTVDVAAGRIVFVPPATVSAREEE